MSQGIQIPQIKGETFIIQESSSKGSLISWMGTGECPWDKKKFILEYVLFGVFCMFQIIKNVKGEICFFI